MAISNIRKTGGSAAEPILSADIDNVEFTSIPAGGKGSGYSTFWNDSANANVWKDNGDGSAWKPSVNAVDLDWNGAQVVKQDKTLTINSSGDLLKLVQDLTNVVFPKFDLNGDGHVDVSDVQELVNKIMTHGGEIPMGDPDYDPLYDHNKDGIIDISDVVVIDNYILSRQNYVALVTWEYKLPEYAVVGENPTNKILDTRTVRVSYSDRGPTDINFRPNSLKIYTNPSCTTLASNRWYRTPGTYYIKGVYQSVETSNYFELTILDFGEDPYGAMQIADSESLGLVKLGFEPEEGESGYYPVDADSEGNAYVHIPDGDIPQIDLDTENRKLTLTAGQTEKSITFGNLEIIDVAENSYSFTQSDKGLRIEFTLGFNQVHYNFPITIGDLILTQGLNQQGQTDSQLHLYVCKESEYNDSLAQNSTFYAYFVDLGAFPGNLTIAQ